MQLDISDNVISGGLKTLSEKCPNLTYLVLSGNDIKEPNAVEALVSCAEGFSRTVSSVLPLSTFPLDSFRDRGRASPYIVTGEVI